jgi:ribosome-binding factor A
VGIGYKRTDRVGDLILKEISEMILKGEVKDPRLSSIVFTGIKITDDLGLARIYFTVMSDGLKKEEILTGLQSATGFIKRWLSKRLRIKKIPDLKFEFDTALEEGYRVDDLLREVKGE